MNWDVSIGGNVTGKLDGGQSEPDLPHRTMVMGLICCCFVTFGQIQQILPHACAGSPEYGGHGIDKRWKRPGDGDIS